MPEVAPILPGDAPLLPEDAPGDAEAAAAGGRDTGRDPASPEKRREAPSDPLSSLRGVNDKFRFCHPGGVAGYPPGPLSSSVHGVFGTSIKSTEFHEFLYLA